MIQGRFNGIEGPASGRGFRGSVSPQCFKASLPGCKVLLTDTLAETQSMQREMRLMTENKLGKQIVDIAVQIHREMGPGLLETVYEIILAH